MVGDDRGWSAPRMWTLARWLLRVDRSVARYGTRPEAVALGGQACGDRVDEKVMILRDASVLPNYVNPLRPLPKLFVKLACFGVLALFSVILGYFIAILPPELFVLPAIPSLVLVVLILWALPDVGSVPKVVSATLLSIFVAANSIWPAYVAVNLPGLPWLNPQRLTLFLLLAAGLYGYSTSSRMRTQTLEATRAAPVIWKSFLVYLVATTIALPFAGESISFSITKWANNQVYWTFLFFISAYVIRRPGGMTVLAKGIMIAGLVTALISVPEAIMERVPWVGYVPNWLIGDPLIYERVSSDQARLDLLQYRARSTFGVSLSFAEFLSVPLPFFIHAAVQTKPLTRKILLIAAAVLIAYAMSILTNARSGMNGLIIGVFGYAAYWAFRRWRTNRNDIIGAGAVLAFPVAIAAFTVLVFAWRRLYVMVIGGGQHSFSNQAREVQWERAFDRLFQNPIGYGPGRANAVIGYTNPGGEPTLDSGYINLLIESGILGFGSFMVLCIATVLLGLKLGLKAKDEELGLAAPAAIAVAAILIIKSVLSQQENLPLLFVIAGAICGLAYRARVADQETLGETGDHASLR